MYVSLKAQKIAICRPPKWVMQEVYCFYLECLWVYCYYSGRSDAVVKTKNSAFSILYTV